LDLFGFFGNDRGFPPVSLTIAALPVATAAASSSESWRPEPPRGRFRTAWEASFGPPPAEAPAMVGWRLPGPAGFLAQAVATTLPSETAAACSSAIARYARMATIEDPVRGGDPVIFRATM
jgi:hypothetical protein